MQTRSFGNDFRLDDWTEDLLVVPNIWGTIGELGLFSEEAVTNSTVVFEERNQTISLIGDRVRGERANVSSDDTRKLHSFVVPHFPLDDAMFPQDVIGVRAYGQPDGTPDNTARKRAEKMEKIRKAHALTLEYARAQLLTAGTVYSPNGTVSQNWFTEFDVTQTTVDFDLDTPSTDVIAKSEEVTAAMQDNAGNGGSISGIIGLCGTTFFQRLINHTNIKAAYQYYASTQDPYRAQRIGAPVSGMHREFVYQGIRYIEMRDSTDGNRHIPVGDCVFVPTGTDAFKTYFAPVQKFGFENTLGEQVYMFEYASQRGDKIEMESESNFVNACMRPAMIIRGYTG